MPPAASVPALQAKVNIFDTYYNTERQHQAPPGKMTPQEAWELLYFLEGMFGSDANFRRRWLIWFDFWSAAAMVDGLAVQCSSRGSSLPVETSRNLLIAFVRREFQIA